MVKKPTLKVLQGRYEELLERQQGLVYDINKAARLSRAVRLLQELTEVEEGINEVQAQALLNHAKVLLSNVYDS